jgi:hypothetical protein
MKQKMADVSFEGIQKTNRQGLLLHKCFFYASGGETGRFITGVFITSFHVCDLFELSDLLPT